MAKKVKITRKQIKQDDKFLHALKGVTKKIVASPTEDESTFEKYKPYLIWGGIVLAVVAVIVAAVWGFTQYRVKGAERLMAQADAIYRVPVVTEEQFNQNPMLRSIGAYTDAKKKWSDAAEHYEAVIAGYANTEYGILSQLYAANCYYELGEYNEAISRYQQYLEKAGNDAPFALLARQSIGYAQEALGKFEEAEQTFLGLTAEEGSTISLLSLFDLARIYEQKDQMDKALATMKKFNEVELTQGPQFYQIKRRAEAKIKMLEARVENGSS